MTYTTLPTSIALAKVLPEEVVPECSHIKYFKPQDGLEYDTCPTYMIDGCDDVLESLAPAYTLDDLLPWALKKFERVRFYDEADGRVLCQVRIRCDEGLSVADVEALGLAIIAAKGEK